MSADSVVLNPPQQARSRRTLERIVNAALEILASEGPAGVTVNAVVDRAHSSVGSFYARFGGKDDLLAYLGERVWEDALLRWKAALEANSWSTMDLGEIIGGAVTLLADIGRSRVAQLRTLDRMSGGGSAYETFCAHVLESLEDLLLERRTEMGHERPELAVRVGLGAVMGLLDGGLANREEAEIPDETLVRECRELLLSYLGGASRGRAGQVDFFEVWG